MNNPKISTETIVGTIMLVISAINMLCNFMGWMPLEIEESSIYQLVSILTFVISTAYSWWHNNSVTPEAIEADKIMNDLKQGNLDNSKVQELLK